MKPIKKELLLITVTGPDHPGITASLMGPLAEAGMLIEDIGQSITHGLLSLSILVDISSNASHATNILKDLLFHAKRIGINLDFQFIDDHYMARARGDKYILSCVSLKGISAAFLKEIAGVLAENKINIQRIDNVTQDSCKSLEINVMAHTESTNWESVKKELLYISGQFQTDIAILKDNVWRRNKRLIVFDMDSTLIQSEVIVEMAKRYGVGDKVHEITEKAMNGEYDFDQSLIERVKLLKGMDEKVLKELLQDIKLTDGTEDFIKIVKKLGYKVAIISGGFNFCTQHFKEKLGLDYAFANELIINDGKLTGEVKNGIVNAEKKAMLLELIAQQENINLEQVVAIGDGANDLQMLAKAGLGIAFHAKEIVKKTAKNHMSHGPMTSILYFLGIPGEFN